MKKLVILNWSAGTGGDLLSSMLLSNSSFTAGNIPVSINESGRVQVIKNLSVYDIFPELDNEQWYNRSWEHDLKKLETLNFDFVLQTVNTQQFYFLKEYFGDKCISVSINYQNNIWQCVLKNFCNKILNSPAYLTDTITGRKFLSVVAKTPDEEEFYLTLSKENKLGLWYFEQYLKGHVSFPAKSVQVPADITITLDELLNKEIFIGKLNFMQKLFGFNLESSTEFYQKWLALQDSVYTLPGTVELHKILGYNNTLPLIDKEFDLGTTYNNLLYEYLN